MLNPFTNRRILKRGERAIATIVEMPSLENRSGPVNAAMVLRIDPDAAAPYEVSDRWLVPGDEPLAVGDELSVAIDPGNRHRVVVDWRRTREELNRHRHVISRVTEPGVPVPVTKVRAAIEEIDPDHFARRRPARVIPVPDPVPEPVAAAALAAEAPADADRAEASPIVADPDLRSVPADIPDFPADLPDATVAESLADTLERLAALHDAGALTDGEFAAAKRHVLEG